MPHSFGLRGRTRDLFRQDFRKHGNVKLSALLRPYHVGDIVDIKANASQQKGMPHKYYHGRTGVVFGVQPRAVQVLIYKTVGNRKIEKRVNLRIEHVKHSKCRDDFLNRVKSNAAKKAEAKTKGERVNVKRQPALPRTSRTIAASKNKPETLAPQPYDTYI
jgi:large subunit ribosomal protein L21e